MHKKNKERPIIAANNDNININQTVKQENIENKSGKKNNCMDTSGDKLKKLHMRHGYYYYHYY